MQITAYEEADYRIKRLRRALEIATRIMGLSEQQADILINGIHDHKGMLQVRWNTYPPTQSQQDAFQTAWGLMHEHEVEHLRAEVGGEA